MAILVIITVSADDLAPQGARASAGAVVTKLMSYISQTFEVLSGAQLLMQQIVQNRISEQWEPKTYTAILPTMSIMN